jgi:hypothetical protein
MSGDYLPPLLPRRLTGSPRHYAGVVSEVLTLRAHIGSLFDYDDQPIPFVYIHLLTLLTEIYMSLCYVGLEIF